ncbi:MAG: histidine phosphatase family protein [Streptosporangiaceae bacterium]
MSPARLVLARHGQAHCNALGIIGGPAGCTGLTSRGRRQAGQLADRLTREHAGRPFDAAYTTPLRRARETAGIVAARLGLPVTAVDDLREPDYGDADGRPWADVVTAFGRIPALHPDEPIAPGAETWAAYLRRATAALQAILGRHPGGTVLVIGHGETVTAAAHLFLGLPASARGRAVFAADYASVTRWEQQPLAWTQPGAGWRWALTACNDTAHLTQA